MKTPTNDESSSVEFSTLAKKKKKKNCSPLCDFLLFLHRAKQRTKASSRGIAFVWKHKIRSKNKINAADEEKRNAELHHRMIVGIIGMCSC